MIFNKLNLKNFKSYKNAEITFDKGITVIVGENGAGKSTIFEAISFALFKEHSASKFDDLVRNNSTEAMSIELDFSVGGNIFRVVREKASSIKSTLLRKSKDNDSFVPICVGDRDVASQIESILNLDKKLFLNAIYVRQGEIAQLVDKTPAEKKKLIGKLLGLDSLEKAWNDLAPQITVYENEKSELRGILKNADEIKEVYGARLIEKEELKSRGKEIEKDLEELKKLKESIKLDLINMDREKEIYKKFINDLEVQKITFENIEKQKNIFSQKINEIEEANDEVKTLKVYVNKLPLYEEFERNIEKIQYLQKESNRLNSELESILTQKEIVSKNEIDYINHNNSIEIIEQLKEDKVEIEKKLAVVTQLSEDKKFNEDMVVTFKKKLDNFVNQKKDQLVSEGVNNDLLADVTDIKILIDILDQHINKIKDTIELVDGKITSNNEEKAKQIQIHEESQNNLESLKTVGSYCPFCQSKINSTRRVELADFFKKEISSTNAKIKSIVGELKELTSKKDKLNQKLISFENISKDIMNFGHEFKSINEYAAKIIEIEKKIQELGVTQNSLGEIILKIKDVENKKDSLREPYDSYIRAIELLKVLPDEREIQEQVEEINNEIVSVSDLMQKAIEIDPFLTQDIDHEDLMTKINDLKAKKEKYLELLGFIKDVDNVKAHCIDLEHQLNVITDKISILETNISECHYDEEKHIELKSNFDGYEAQYIQLNTELQEIKKNGKKLMPLIEDLENKIEIYNVYQQQHDNLKEYIHLLTVFRDLYSKNGIQRDLRNRSRPLIQKYTKSFFSQFNFDYSDLIMDEDYNITVFGPEGESSLDMVSGGEKIAIALSLRLGITQALSRGASDTILLDEPTIFLDSARRHELINLIKEMTLLPQMIIVTHEPQLESAADNLIKVEKVNGISKIS